VRFGCDHSNVLYADNLVRTLSKAHHQLGEEVSGIRNQIAAIIEQDGL
jgi:hypothetical protein